MEFDTFIYYVELFSITAISIYGALIAAKCKLDVFGVICVGVVSSLGGGVCRDLILGIHPPFSFHRPMYAATAIFFSLAAFLVEYTRAKRNLPRDEKADRIRDFALLTIDTIGLATFTVVGVAVAYEYTTNCNHFTIIFVGAVTGVGGGVMRDIIVGRRPYIFVKHVYAMASLGGSVLATYLWVPLGKIPAMAIGALFILVVRTLAARFKWNMPSVPYPEK